MSFLGVSFARPEHVYHLPPHVSSAPLCKRYMHELQGNSLMQFYMQAACRTRFRLYNPSFSSTRVVAWLPTHSVRKVASLNAEKPPWFSMKVSALFSNLSHFHDQHRLQTEIASSCFSQALLAGVIVKKEKMRVVDILWVSKPPENFPVSVKAPRKLTRACLAYRSYLV